MRAIVFGATGMVGQGVLRECLLDPEVTQVLCVVRRSTGRQDAKLVELVHGDFSDFSAIADALTGYDACFFCLGVSAAGLTEAEYTRITYDTTLSAARVLLERNPAMVFLYVSGAGTDSSEKGWQMWARVKGKTENALLRLGFRAAYLCRPGFILPMHGIRASNALYRTLYAVTGPLYPVFKALTPGLVSTTENVGRGMLEAAKHGADGAILENAALNALAARSRH